MVLAAVCFILACILFFLDFLFGFPLVPAADPPARSWRGVSTSLAFFFLALGLFFMNGGLPK